ncbi:MAG: hypothetical protein ABSH32_18245 [Bryobacteraceae bacterium]|jgi:hypothetical protein
MNHCLAQVFRVGLSLRLPKSDFVRCPVVFHNQWMIHRDICRPLFKIAYRVAPCGHHVAQQLIRFRHRTGRPVDEARLDASPSLYKARPIGCREWPDVKPLHSFCTLLESGFRMPAVAAYLHGASIFSSAELSAKSLSLPLSVQKERRDS